MRGRSLVRLAAVGLIAVFACAAAWAEVKLPAIIGDNMVLQTGKPVPIWGWTSPGDTVTVLYRQGPTGGVSAKAQAGADGRWQATLPTLAPGGPAELIVKDSSGAKTLRNVLVGEVWVGSGQSNMQFTVKASADAEQEIAAAKYPKIRFFSVERETADAPRTDCTGQWRECTPETVPEFSAVAYFFARQLHKDLGVPVGAINTSWGGTPAESWTSRPALEAESSLRPMLARWDRQVADAPQAEAAAKQQLAAWQQAVAKAKAAGQKEPGRPWPFMDPRTSPHRPASLFNGMIAPLVPYAIRGAIWYQGESNVTRAWEYRTLFPLMIRNWRSAWGQGDFPFGFVQLAPFNYRNDPCWCAELREAQVHTLKTVPGTGMAVTMDIGNLINIHPTNKQEVGRRLELWALAKVYGKNVVYSGPLYESMAVEGSKVRIRFAHAGSGLTTSDGKAPSQFAVAGADQRFFPAQAAIDGNTLLVSSADVPKPAAVRFAWADTAQPNLRNKEGLPASPFKTDTWRWLTETGALGTPGIDALVGQDSPLHAGERIAFLGDSITQQGAGQWGYVWLLEDALARRRPELKAEIIRAGISGNRVPDLQARLERDVLAKKPTVVFIYIGINDVWHSVKGHGTPKDQYEAGLRDLIARIQGAGATVVLATPSVIGEKTDGNNPLDKMLDEYTQVSRQVAQSTGVQLCDLRFWFAAHLKQFNAENKEKGVLTVDGVHLSPLGNRLVADRAADGIVAALKKRK